MKTPEAQCCHHPTRRDSDIVSPAHAAAALELLPLRDSDDDVEQALISLQEVAAASLKGGGSRSAGAGALEGDGGNHKSNADSAAAAARSALPSKVLLLPPSARRASASATSASSAASHLSRPEASEAARVDSDRAAELLPVDTDDAPLGGGGGGRTHSVGAWSFRHHGTDSGDSGIGSSSSGTSWTGGGITTDNTTRTTSCNQCAANGANNSSGSGNNATSRGTVAAAGVAAVLVQRRGGGAAAAGGNNNSITHAADATGGRGVAAAAIRSHSSPIVSRHTRPHAYATSSDNTGPRAITAAEFGRLRGPGNSGATPHGSTADAPAAASAAVIETVEVDDVSNANNNGGEGGAADPNISGADVAITVPPALPLAGLPLPSGGGAGGELVVRGRGGRTVVIASPVASSTGSMVEWAAPDREIFFREWYIFNWCSEEQVALLHRCQHIGGPRAAWLLRLNFKLWSFTGEAEFYIVFIPTLLFLGFPYDATHVASLLCMGQYVTGTLKDLVWCPRPPCPPLEMRGKRVTHDTEYGFPSTHSSHSAVFAYFMYNTLIRFAPNHKFLCWLVSVVYLFNVSYSRLFLGMHWLGDLIGGWSVAFACILVHVAFVDRWEQSLITLYPVPWYVLPLPYALMHALASWHAAPRDPCPCYVDSCRFLGVLAGSFYGFWTFTTIYGGRADADGVVMVAARPEPRAPGEVLFTLSFLWQWVVLITLVVVSKELASLGAKLVLPPVFKCLSGAYAPRLPRAARAPYLFVARLIGRTTRWNERGPWGPVMVRRGAAAAATGPLTDDAASTVSSDDTTRVGGSGGFAPQQPREEQESAIAAAAADEGNAYSSAPGAESTTTGGGGGHFAPGSATASDGYLNSQQAWSLKTHRHWWCWEVHQRTLSYFVAGFIITAVCSAIQRSVFGVGRLPHEHHHHGVSTPFPTPTPALS